MAGISINLAGNFAKLDELKDKAGKTAASLKSAFGSNIGKAMFAGVAAASAAAFATVVAGMKSAIDAGGELSDMVARTGADGAKLFVLQQAFKNAGMAAEQVPQVLNKMQKALAGVNEEGDRVTNRVFTDLGLSVAELQSMDPAAAFRQISEAVAAVPDPARRAALAMEIFGKSAGQLLVMMTDSKAISTAETQVGDLAKTLADNANQLDAVADSMGLFQVKIQQVGAEVAVSLLPQLTQFSDWINETDFSGVGGGIGIMVENVVSLGSALSEVAKYMPMLIAFQKIADMTIGGDLTDADRAKAKAMADQWAASDPMHGKSQDEVAAQNRAGSDAIKAEAETAAGAKDREKEAKAADSTAKAAATKAAAEKKTAEEKAKSMAAAVAEYNIESEILSARLAGDEKRIASAERLKKIREEMQRLESAGFTADESRKPAEAKVDAEIKIAEREDAETERQKLKDKLGGELDNARGRMDGQQFQSSIGAISSMQRIGGGGGAVGSGLDYARQSADLQRETNGLIRQLIEVNRREVEV